MKKLDNGKYEIGIVGLLLTFVAGFFGILLSVVFISLLPSLIPYFIVVSALAFLATRMNK